MPSDPTDNECLKQILLEFTKVITCSSGLAYVNKGILCKAIRKSPVLFANIAIKHLFDLKRSDQWRENEGALIAFVDRCYSGKISKKSHCFDLLKIKGKWVSPLFLANLFPTTGNRARYIGSIIVPYLDHKTLLSICLAGYKKQNINKIEEELKKDSISNDPEMLNFRRAAYQELSRRKISRFAACGSRYTIVVMEDGTLLSFGNNEHGQLGRKTTGNNNPTPRAINLGNKRAIQVACGKNHTVVLMEDGKIMTFGDNEMGQLGRYVRYENNRTPGVINLSANKKAIQVACGENHTVVLTEDGKLMSFGDNEMGQLGRNLCYENNRTPGVINLSANKKAVQVVCGANHTVLLMEDGKIMSFGYNDMGQLGRKTGIINPFDEFTEDDIDDYIVYAADKNPGVINLGKAIQVACGQNHTVVLTEDGKLMSFGNNSFGQLGRGTRNHNVFEGIQYPGMINLEKTMQVACGAEHTVVLMKDGIFLSFGNNKLGQLGRQTTNQITNLVPKAIKLNGRNKKAVQVVCGANHTVVLMEDGTLLSFGDNEFGQLGRQTANRLQNRTLGVVNLPPYKEFKLENAIIRWMPEWRRQSTSKCTIL